MRREKKTFAISPIQTDGGRIIAARVVGVGCSWILEPTCDVGKLNQPIVITFFLS